MINHILTPLCKFEIVLELASTGYIGVIRYVKFDFDICQYLRPLFLD